MAIRRHQLIPLKDRKQVRIATTANITLSGLTAIDGITPVVGDRVLVKNQTTTANNGIYVAATGAWARAEDYKYNNYASGHDLNQVSGGTFVYVLEGTRNGRVTFQVVNVADPDIGTDPVTIEPKAPSWRALKANTNAGTESVATSISSLAFGEGASATGTGAIALGEAVSVTNTNSVALGGLTVTVSGREAAALGSKDTTITGDGGVTVGGKNQEVINDGGTIVHSKYAIVGGIHGSWAACRVATTGNITLSGLTAIDGITPVVGDRVLVKNQTTTANNGIYVAAAGAWSRTTDADASAEFVQYKSVLVVEGTTNYYTVYTYTGITSPTLGSTALTFVSGAIEAVVGSPGSSLDVSTSSRGSIIIGGAGHASSGRMGIVLGGAGNTISGDSVGLINTRDSSVTADEVTLINASFSSVSSNHVFGSGIGVKGHLPRTRLFSGGFFSESGDAQLLEAMLRIQTTDATVTRMSLDGLTVNSTNRLFIPSEKTWNFFAKVTARSTAVNGNNSAVFTLSGGIKNDGGTVSFVNSITPTLVILAREIPSWTVAAIANDGNDSLDIQVTGAAATNINWVCHVEIVEDMN